MRKVLFWVLIIIFLFLLVVLGFSFRNNTTPLTTLKGRFGVQESVQISTDGASDKAQFIDTTEKIKQAVSTESGVYVPATGSTAQAVNVSGQKLSEQDKQDVKNLIDSLIVK